MSGGQLWRPIGRAGSLCGRGFHAAVSYLAVVSDLVSALDPSPLRFAHVVQLLKLADVKSGDRSMTLLDYIVGICRGSDVYGKDEAHSILHWAQPLTLETTARVSFSQVQLAIASCASN